MRSNTLDRMCRSLSVDLVPDTRRSDLALVPISQSTNYRDLSLRIHTGNISRVEACNTSGYQRCGARKRLRAGLQDTIAWSVTKSGALILRRILWSARFLECEIRYLSERAIKSGQCEIWIKPCHVLGNTPSVPYAIHATTAR